MRSKCHTKKDKQTEKKYRNTFINFLAVIFIASIVYAVVLIAFIFLPKFNLIKYYDISKILINGTHNAWGILLTIYTVFISTFGVLLFKGKKREKNFFKFFLLVGFSVGFLFPLFVSCFGIETVEIYTQQMDELKRNNIQVIQPPEDKEPEETGNEEYVIVFRVDYNDVLFEAYDLKDIEANKSLLKQQISGKIHSEIENFNQNADKKSFEEIIKEVDDYELTYKYYCDTGLFLKVNPDERINKLNEAIKIRKEADNKFKNSENQRLIAIRYIELGDEMRRRGNQNEAIEYYKKSIFWNLNALQTLYNENPNNNGLKMYDNIIRAYKYMTELYNENDEYEFNRRAAILYDLYSSIVADLDKSDL